jgi:hypothetical protein
MKRLEKYQAKLKAANAEFTIRVREYNTAKRALSKVTDTIHYLDWKIEDEKIKLAQVASRTKSVN